LLNDGIDIFYLNITTVFKCFQLFDFWRNKILETFLLEISLLEAADKHHFSIHFEIAKEKEKIGISKTPKLWLK